MDGLAMAMVSAWGRCGWGQRRCLARLSAQLDILRLITRGLARSRRLGSRWCRISDRLSAAARASRVGGKRRLGGDLAADHVQATGEGEPVGVLAGLLRALPHQLSDGVVHQQEGVHLLLDSVGVASVARGLAIDYLNYHR